jgi:GNAT superfamily N-acetyltransferase
MEQPSPTEIAVRIAREAIPAPMLGNHRVPFTGGPERFAAYVDGAGTLAPAGAVAPGPYDYYCDAPGLIGFLDIYRDAATETLYVGYINVRPDFRRRGVAWSLVRALLDAYPQTAKLEWGLLVHVGVQRIYLRQYREGKVRVTGWRSEPDVPRVYTNANLHR